MFILKRIFRQSKLHGWASEYQRRGCAAALSLAAAAIVAISPAQAQDKKPNILVIWGDDIEINNISAYNLGAYNLGVMGYKTPNIDRLAKEGALFTDSGC